MKAKLVAAAAAVGLAWMANGLASSDHNMSADLNQPHAYKTGADESRESSSPRSDRKTDRRDSSESMMNGMSMMEGMKNMMGRMMNGGMMSGGMMDGCPMMGGSQPNRQWRDRRPEK
ncbi:MAG: hypothetical protein ACT4PS_01285 [Betaproteobacteria bacterium]